MTHFLLFEDSTRPTIHPVYRRVSLASYEYKQNPDILLAWADRVQDPTGHVMFLVTDILPHPGLYSGFVPHYLITDTKVWCPLVCGRPGKYRSYATGYNGIKLTTADQAILIEWIEKYVETLD